MCGLKKSDVMNIKFEHNIQSMLRLKNIIAENAFELRADLVGIFDVDEEWVDKLKANAVAIMFPYLRSQLTLLTSQPEMMPIILPTVNINKLLESNKDK